MRGDSGWRALDLLRGEGPSRRNGGCLLPLNVLFLCTGNSARSIMAEAMLNHLGRDRFRAFSAGSHPTGQVNPRALATLEAMGIPARDARSKAWDEFAAPGAPPVDIVITVCDEAAGETCPIWPGRPAKAHWGVADPAAAQGSDEETRAAFTQAAAILRRRVECLVALPMERLSDAGLQGELDAAGRL